MALRQDASTGQMVDDGTTVVADDKTGGKPVVALKIYSPFHIYFDEPAFSISAINATGPFDVLPKHHSFLSLLNACEMHIQAPSGEKRIRISGGLLQVHNDTVKVFLDV